MFATADLHVTCLQTNTEEGMSHALEGSADSLILFGEKRMPFPQYTTLNTMISWNLQYGVSLLMGRLSGCTK